MKDCVNVVPLEVSLWPCVEMYEYLQYVNTEATAFEKVFISSVCVFIAILIMPRYTL